MADIEEDSASGEDTQLTSKDSQYPHKPVYCPCTLLLNFSSDRAALQPLIEYWVANPRVLPPYLRLTSNFVLDYDSTACSLPPDYCKFSSNFSKCKPWLLKNYPQLYPELADGTSRNGPSGLTLDCYAFTQILTTTPPDPEVLALSKQVDGVTVIDDNAVAAATAGTYKPIDFT